MTNIHGNNITPNFIFTIISHFKRHKISFSYLYLFTFLKPYYSLRLYMGFNLQLNLVHHFLWNDVLKNFSINANGICPNIGLACALEDAMTRSTLVWVIFLEWQVFDGSLTFLNSISQLCITPVSLYTGQPTLSTNSLPLSSSWSHINIYPFLWTLVS